ncbi:MAG: metalloregulator ArsR/SmtB family transcription factor [Nitrospiraceae bacterium]|nr:metalloregulator ArsR/SmtB family transcription factor [Nitrospiraceae bacterium]
MREFMDIAKALADENRVRALMILKDTELCVCQIIELLGLAPSTVSKHMAILRQARLVEGRKEGRWIHYRRADAESSPYLADTLAWLDQCLENNATTRADCKKLKEILKVDPEEICKRQAKCG